MVLVGHNNSNVNSIISTDFVMNTSHNYDNDLVNTDRRGHFIYPMIMILLINVGVTSKMAHKHRYNIEPLHVFEFSILLDHICITFFGPFSFKIIESFSQEYLDFCPWNIVEQALWYDSFSI